MFSGIIKNSLVVFAAMSLVVGGFFVAAPNALAAGGVTITPASYVGNISIDTTSDGGTNTSTSLEGPGIAETAPGSISTGTHTILLPQGWEIDNSSPISILKMGTIGISNTITTSPDFRSFSFTINSVSTVSGSFVGFNGLKVKPTTKFPSTGEILHSSGVITGVTNESTSFGTLSTVPGTVTKVAFTRQPGATTVYGSNLSTQPVIETQDRFGNNSTNGLSGAETVTLSLIGNGTLSDITSHNISSGAVIFNNLTVNAVGIGKQLVATPATPTIAIATSDSFKITPALLTITADAKTKVYGTANPDLTASYTGFVNNETSDVVSGLSIVTSADATTPVGTPAIIPSGATAANYDISYHDGILTITEAPLTITADAKTKVYGDDDPGLTYVVTSGALVNNNILGGSLSRAAGENVGAKAISSTLSNSNYAITFVPANLTITTRPITVTAVTNTKTYNGLPTAEGTPTITSGSLATGDTATFSETYDTSITGANKTLTPSVIIKNGNDVDVTANYGITPVTNSTGVITLAPLTITAENKTKIYGTANPGLTAIYSGFVNGETSAVLDTPVVLSTIADTTTNVGAPAITASSAVDVNYDITFVPGILTITQAPLTISFTTDTDKTYDGNVTANIISRTLDGVISSDVVNAVGGSATFVDKNIGTTKTVTASGFTLDGADKDNYSIGIINTTTGNIVARPITITAKTDTKTYDSLANSDETPIITSSFSPAIATVDTANFTQAYDNENVGTGKTLTPSGSVTDGNSGNNYSYTFVTNTAGEITQAPLTATITVSNKVVDGNTSATILTRTLFGKIGSDDVTLNANGVATFADAGVGNGKVVTAIGITLAGTDAGNYSYTSPATGTGNILAIPTVVYVNKNWNGTTLWTDPDGAGIGATFFGYDAFATIQEAIGKVAVSGTVNVAAGTYNEALNINKSLTLNGAKVGLDARKRDTSSGESILDGAGFTTAQYSLIIIANGVSDVVIDGFEFKNILLTSTGGGVGNAISSYSGSSGTAGADNITIKNNYMHDLGYNGILVTSENTTGTSMIIQSGWTIQHNKITNYRYAGVELTNVINSQVKDNDIAAPTSLFADPGDAGVGIEIAARSKTKPVTAGTNVEVSGNTITGTFPTGSRAAINLLSRAYSSTSNAILSGVTVSGNNISGAINVRAAILSVAESRLNGPATISSLTITNNILDGNLDAIEIEDCVKSGTGTATHSLITVTGNEIKNSTGVGLHVLSNTSASGITISSNKILTNVLFGIKNEGTGILIASRNWWGTAVLATIQSKVTPATVTVAPYYITSDTGAGGILSDVAVNTVYVDDNYADGLENNGHTFGYNAFATIQEGINAVAFAGTVNVAEGDYTENLIVDKSLTINGAGVGTVISSIKSTGDSVTIQSLKIINSNSHDGGVSDYGVKATAGKALTLETVTVDVLHDAISMTGDSTINNTTLTINNSIIKGYGALVISGAINSTGTKSAIVTINNTSLTGRTSYSGSSDDFSVIGTTNTNKVNINFTGTSSVTNEYTDTAQAKERLISFYNSDNIVVTGSPTYTNAGNSKVSTDARFVSAYGPYTNTVAGQVVARYAQNTAEFESALASDATTPIVVGRYETAITTTKDSTLKTGVTLIVEDNTPVTINTGHTLTNNGTIIVETGATLINNGTLQSVAVTGTARYGQELTAAITGLINVGTPAYQWKRNGSPISGATAATYTLVSADVGTVITATATVSGITGTGSITSAGTVAVAKTPITITADAKTKTYGGADPDLLTYTITSGVLINGDTLTGSLSRAAGENVGTYAISSSLVNSNYVITFVGADLTITKAPLTITAVAKTKVYGDADPELTYTTSPFVNSENTSVLTGSLSRAEGANVGTYAISSSLVNSNYNITYVPANLTITAKPITITANANDKGFGLSDPTPLTSYAVTSGSKLDSDSFIGSLTRDTGEALGIYTINQGTLSLGSNYTITYVPALFSIKDITAPTIISKTPSASAVGVDPTTNITVVFNENVVINSSMVTISGGVGKAVTFDSGTNTATIDPSITLSNNTTYTITLTGVTDTAGNTLSTTSWVFTTSASYSMTLTTGWNLISLPVVPINTNASAVLGATLNDAAKIETVWKYNPVAGTWGAYHPGNSETSNFSTMTAGEGYWINYLSGTVGTIAGTGNLFQAGNNTPPQKSLSAGWNLIGYYQLENRVNTTATNALSTVAGQWTQLRTYSNTDKQFQAVIGSDDMKPGEGYWIFMKSSSYAPYLYGPGD